MKEGFLLCIRLILGGSFLYFGWVKTQDPDAFLKVSREFELIGDHRLMNMVAAAGAEEHEVEEVATMVRESGERITMAAVEAALSSLREQ